MKIKIKDNDMLRARMNAIDLEAACQLDLSYARGFIITDTPYLTDDKKKTNINGPRSSKFASSYQDDFAFIERHRCECGSINGAYFQGNICPKCGTAVEFREPDIMYTGWLSWGPWKIIHPRYFKKLNQILSTKVLHDILNIDNICDINGNIRPYDSEFYVKVGKKGKMQKMAYYNIGLRGFYDNYEEILRHFSGKKKPNEVEMLIRDKHKVFTSVYPVYSTLLRPQMISNNSISFASVDKEINPICKLTTLLREAVGLDVDSYLNSIQTRVCNLWNEVVQIIDGKHGSIRSQVIGGMLNFTARNVIVLDPTLEKNEIDIGISLVLELYKSEIVREIMEDKKVPLPIAFDIVDKAYTGSDYVADIADKVIHQHNAMLTLHRNPILQYRGVLRMKIRRIYRDPNYLVLAIPESILTGQNADFDGDIENIMKIPFGLEYMFEKYDPAYNMCIDRANNSVFKDLKELSQITWYNFSTIPENYRV
jgi:hypothetical protein